MARKFCLAIPEIKGATVGKHDTPCRSRSSLPVLASIYIQRSYSYVKARDSKWFVVVTCDTGWGKLGEGTGAGNCGRCY